MGWPKVTLNEATRSNIAKASAILNWICIAPSIIVMCVGAYIEVSLQSKINIIQDYSGKALPVFLISFGLFSAVSNIVFGKVCIANQTPEKRKDWSKYLLPSVIVGLVIFICVFISGILCFVYVSHLRDSFHKGLITSMFKYKNDVLTKQEIDILQIEFECCGSESFTDWFKVQWIHEEYIPTSKKSDGPYFNDDVPFSCCSPESPRPCIHHHVMDNTLHYNYDYRSSLTLHGVGCRDKLTDYYGRGMLVNVGAIVVSISLLQITIVILTRFLQTSIQAVLDADDNPLTPADGYIFPWGKTAIRAVKEEIKKYHKKDRGEEDDEEPDEPLVSEKKCDFGSDEDSFDSDFDSIGEDEKDNTYELFDDVITTDVPRSLSANVNEYGANYQDIELNGYSVPENEYQDSRREPQYTSKVILPSDVIYEEIPQRRGSMSNFHHFPPTNTSMGQHASQREFQMSGNVSSIHAAPAISPLVSHNRTSGYLNDQVHNYGSFHPLAPPPIPDGELTRQVFARTASRYVNDNDITNNFNIQSNQVQSFSSPISTQELSSRTPVRTALKYVNDYISPIPPAPPVPNGQMYILE